MKDYKKEFADVGALVPHILLPTAGVDFQKFSVVACDQHSAEPEYWDEVKELVGDSPSALNLMLPEAWLEQQSESSVQSISDNMQNYLDDNTLVDIGECLILVHRMTDSGIRKGLMIALDLEQYNFFKGSKSLVRSTEDTIVERLPARIAVREKAAIEMPHVIVLIDDKLNMLDTVLERNKEGLKLAYNFNLMKDGGEIRGRIINEPLDLLEIAKTLKILLEQSGDGFMYAMGDGNHSFAAAKQRWESLKKELSLEQQKKHPARYSLVEIVNLYDKGLAVEPIHRLLIGVNPEQIQREIGFDAANPPSLQQLQPMLDKWLVNHPEVTQEYIHGEEECRELGQGEDRLAIVFGDFSRDSIFSVVRENGAFVRKSFSLGNASGKRYYLECRKIVE